MARACQRLHTVSRPLLVNGNASSPTGDGAARARLAQGDDRHGFPMPLIDSK